MYTQDFTLVYGKRPRLSGKSREVRAKARPEGLVGAYKEQAGEKPPKGGPEGLNRRKAAGQDGKKQRFCMIETGGRRWNTI